MTDPKPPEHSGAAISILKIQPRDDMPIVITSEGVGVDGVIADTHAIAGRVFEVQARLFGAA